MRFKKSIQPNELKSEYNPNTYFSIKLPSGKVDLHSFTLYYDGLPANYANTNGTTATGVGATVFQRTIRRFFPRLSSCIVGELIIKVNNQVKQHINEYNMIDAILNDIRKDEDDLNGTSFDTLQQHRLDQNSTIQNTLKIQAVDNHLPKYVDEFQESFFISEWLGMLNEGNVRYLDTTNMDIEIQIKLAPASILYRGINSIDTVTQNIVTAYPTDYRLSNIYATIDVLDDIPAQPSEFEFLDYHFTRGETRDDNKKSLTSFNISKPVKWLLGTFATRFREDDNALQLSHANPIVAIYGALLKETVTLAQLNQKIPIGLLYSYDVAKQQKDPYLLNSSIYFDREGLGISYCKYRWNGYDLTPRMNIPACYQETKKCFNSKYKRVISIPSFQSDFFANAIRVDDNSNELKIIEWEVENDPRYILVGGTPMLFCCYVNKL